MTENIGSFWQDIVRRPTLEEFATAFTPNVVFETSSCNRQVEGPADLHTLVRTMSSLYERLAFSARTDSGNATYLVWNGRSEGEDIAGVTLFRRDTSGRLIESVFLHQRPLRAVVRFAGRLAKLSLPGFTFSDFAIG